MDEYLKTQLRLMIIGTILWLLMLCITYSEYQYYLLGHLSCWEACIFPDILVGVTLFVFWVVWIKEYKKYKTKIR